MSPYRVPALKSRDRSRSQGSGGRGAHSTITESDAQSDRVRCQEGRRHSYGCRLPISELIYCRRRVSDHIHFCVYIYIYVNTYTYKSVCDRAREHVLAVRIFVYLLACVYC